MMKKKTKKNIFKIVLFLIVASLLIFCFWFFKGRKLDVPPSENPSTENPPNPSGEEEPSKEPDPEGTSYLNHITYTKEIDKEIEKTIIEYMDVYYKAMKELKEYDMTYLFSNPTGDQAYINQTAVSLLVEIRKLKPTDLTLSNVKYDLNITKAKQEGDSITVTVLENNYLHFNFMKDIESKVYNIENEFTLKKVDGKYKIVKYDKVQDFFVMVTDKYSSGGKAKLDDIKNNYLAIIKKNVETEKTNYQNFLAGTGITRKTCDHPYNRDKALEYALKWVNKRNPDWIKFDSNCQNYASQVVNIGGVPMDTYGEAEVQWKLYSSSYNANETATGLVYSWTYVPSFREYAKNNTGYGMCADVDVNLYYAEAGDVIHVGTTGPTRHALVVIGTYVKDNNVVDILVNSNTVDLENYPMSAYVYPYTSLIKIYGWNNE